MEKVYICDAIRTPIGKYGGMLSSVRTDDLAALPIKEILKRNPTVDWNFLDEVFLGCANQAGEDNRNIARMATLLAGLPFSVPAMTLNRLCGSGMDAVGTASRGIMTGEIGLAIAGGAESMSRAPYVLSKAESPFGRNQQCFDTTMAWRFVNPKMHEMYGTDPMPVTAENVAEKYNITREEQDNFALMSQQRVKAAKTSGCFDDEIFPVEIVTRKSSKFVSEDEAPRENTTFEGLSNLRTPFKENGTVTAGNASGINDGACAILLANEENVARFDLKPLTRVIGMVTVGTEPRYMGIAPVAAITKLLTKHKLSLGEIDVIEINEAFAAQAVACLKLLNLPTDSPNVNPNGGAISLGHPLGMSGARIITTASYQLQRTGGRYAICSMCIGVGQGIAVLLENVEKRLGK